MFSQTKQVFTGPEEVGVLTTVVEPLLPGSDTVSYSATPMVAVGCKNPMNNTSYDWVFTELSEVQINDIRTQRSEKSETSAYTVWLFPAPSGESLRVFQSLYMDQQIRTDTAGFLTLVFSSTVPHRDWNNYGRNDYQAHNCSQAQQHDEALCRNYKTMSNKIKYKHKYKL